jgi:hypothetical protein
MTSEPGVSLRSRIGGWRSGLAGVMLVLLILAVLRWAVHILSDEPEFVGN